MNATRGTGTTSTQMRATPMNGVYIWCNDSLYYPRALARHLGREDLKIVAPAILDEYERLLGHTGVTLDHAAGLNQRRRAAFDRIHAQVRSHREAGTKAGTPNSRAIEAKGENGQNPKTHNP